jgi:hypothetical protein
MNEALNNVDPNADWNAARTRLAAYLAALEVTGQANQDRILSEIIAKARAQFAAGNGSEPAALAASLLQLRMEEWFSKLLGAREHAIAKGVVSLLAINSRERWPDAFLHDEPPPDFINALQRVTLSAAPDLSFSSMVPQPFENPLPDKLELPAPLNELSRGLSPVMAKLLALAALALTFLPGGRAR